MAEKNRWTIRLAASAEADMRRILRWTRDRFGEAQAQTYAQTLRAALEALAQTGLNTAGAKARDDIGKGLYTLHVARHGRKGRHLVLFRAGYDAQSKRASTLDILRILHDAMDLPRYRPSDDGIE
jgi:toxin ParE1/3/4